VNGVVELPDNGVRVERQRVGDGPPLVFLHGAFGPEWSQSLVDALARAHTVLAPCLPGYGDSDGLERIASFHDLSTWLDEVLDAEGLEQVTLVGHDFGGAAAAEYAALFRRRVSRLVLIAPYGLWPEGEPLADIFGLTPGSLQRLLYGDPTGEAAQAFSATDPDPARQQAAVLRRRQALIAAAKLLWPIPDKGLKRRLYRVGAPTLLLAGRHDRLMDATYIGAFAQAIAGARTLTLEAGHMIPHETPAAAADAITAFLREARAA
jgi:pimeloyl-ACP methyl ester carboxylesterase